MRNATMSSDARALGVASALGSLLELGPPSEVRTRSPAVAAGALDLDRVLLTSLDGGLLTAQALYREGDADSVAGLIGATVRLDYPLVEGEIMRRRRAQWISADEPRGRHAFADLLGGAEYVVAPIIVDGTVLGFFYGDRQASGRVLSDDDARELASFAVCFGLVYERAALRLRLRVQRQEIRRVATWADSRAGELRDRAMSLADGLSDRDEQQAVEAPRTNGEDALRDLLTRRELDVLRLMVRGETNGGIARDLVVSEGTIKFHVKNILRKLHASNRAEATSRYLRLTLSRGDG